MDENPYKAPTDPSLAEHEEPDDRLDLIEWAAHWLSLLAIPIMVLMCGAVAIFGCLPG